MTPLAGVRVLEFGQYTAGPYCTRMLAELGAEVVKVEPREGEPMRQLQPQIGSQSYFFHLNNANKRSVTLDITHRDAAPLYRSLAQISDVIVENFGFGVAARRGIDYQHARRANRQIVYCSIKGFGADSAMAQRAAYDAVIQAETGIMTLTRSSTGMPVKAGISISDLLGATVATAKVVTALIDRRRTGVGAFLHVSLYHTSGWASMLQGKTGDFSMTNETSAASAEGVALPFRQYVDATDGRAVIEAKTSTQMQALKALACQADRGDCPQQIAEQPFTDLVRRWASTRTVACAVDACARYGIPANALLTVDEAMAHPHAKARGILTHASNGDSDVVINATPFRSDGSPAAALIGTPGADNDYVYKDLLGLSEHDLKALSASGVI